jgi:hypothetical protein
MKAIKKLSVGIAVCFFLTSSLAKAQFGIAAGVSTGNVKLESVSIDRDQNKMDITGRNITGYELAAFAKLDADLIYVKPMALLGYQTGHVMAGGEQVTYRSNRFAVPVLVGYELAGPLSIEAGPVYSYLGDVTRNFDGRGDLWNTKQHGLGYRAGLVADFGPWMLNATFEGLTYDLGNSARPGLKEPAKIIFGAGYTFGDLNLGRD